MHPIHVIRLPFQMFAMAEHGTDIVRSVTLLYKRSYDTSPLRHIISTLGKPRSTDVPTPHSAFTKEWSREEYLNHGSTVTEATSAELFVFENATAAKKFELFVWTIEKVNALHYAFLLQVVDM